MKLFKTLIFLIVFLLCAAPGAMAQPSAGSDLGSKSVTDLGDVTGTSGTGTVLATGIGPFTNGECAEFDVNGDLVASGGSCGGTPATTEAALEAQITDVTDIFTDNDGALDDDDVSDDNVSGLADVTAKSGNTTVLGTTSGVLVAGNCAEFDASGNILDSGDVCGGTPVSTEAALEAQITDVTDIFTDNDGALDDDDVSDDNVSGLADVTAKSGNTTVLGTTLTC
jgi:hypothetical protein